MRVEEARVGGSAAVVKRGGGQEPGKERRNNLTPGAGARSVQTCDSTGEARFGSRPVTHSPRDRYKRIAQYVGAACCAAWVVILLAFVLDEGFPPRYHGMYVPPILTSVIAFFLPYWIVRGIGQFVEETRAGGGEP